MLITIQEFSLLPIEEKLRILKESNYKESSFWLMQMADAIFKNKPNGLCFLGEEYTKEFKNIINQKQQTL